LANDFMAYLKELDEKEKLGKDAAKQAADRNYTEWADHLSILKRNFGETYELFRSISGNVTNWSTKSFPTIGSGLMWTDEGGYSFIAGLYRTDPSTRRANPQIGVSFGTSDAGMGDERAITTNPRLNGAPLELETVKSSSRFNEYNTKTLLEKIDRCKVQFKVSGIYRNTLGIVEDNVELCAEREVGILYYHRLADICKGIFIDCVENGIKNNDLEKLIPTGEFGRRRGNITGAEDNTIIHAEDPQWRNG
jgi:hypothetical protein